jgi:hypothetical protein
MRFEEAQQKLYLAIQFYIEAGDIPGRASDLRNLGCLLSRQNLPGDAEAKFTDAIVLHEKIGDVIGKAYDMTMVMSFFSARSLWMQKHVWRVHYTSTLKSSAWDIARPRLSTLPVSIPGSCRGPFILLLGHIFLSNGE